MDNIYDTIPFKNQIDFYENQIDFYKNQIDIYNDQIDSLVEILKGLDIIDIDCIDKLTCVKEYINTCEIYRNNEKIKLKLNNNIYHFVLHPELKIDIFTDSEKIYTYNFKQINDKYLFSTNKIEGIKFWGYLTNDKLQINFFK